MPQLPKILADLGEKGFGVHCTVIETEYIDTNLKRIRFQTDLRKTLFVPGQVTQFRVSANDFRHYTPSLFDRQQGIYDILFYLHDKGPGSKWASTLEAGHSLKMLGTGGKMKLVSDNRYHFFFGDETSLGLFHCMKEAIHQRDHEYLGILELNKEALHWPEKIGLSVDTASKSLHQSPASEAIEYLNDLQGLLWCNWKNASFYLAGRAASVQAFRKALLIKGVRNNNINTLAYWSDGKKGL